MTEVASELRAIGREIRGVPKGTMLAAVLAVKKISDQEVGLVVGSDLAMSNFGSGRTKIRLQDDLKVGTDQAEVTMAPWPSVAGPWSWLEHGTRAHFVGTRLRNGKRKRMVIGGNVRMGPTKRPTRMQPRHVFTRLADRAEVEVPKICAEELGKAVTK